MIKKSSLLIIFCIVILFLVYFASAEKLEIKINKADAENVNFKTILYDDKGSKINGVINYEIKNYYSEIISNGMVNSGETVDFKMLKNPRQGPWEISASYENVKTKELFEVNDLEKAEIRLEGDNLIIKNIGNVWYDKNILIYIGDNDQTAKVYLEVGQIKKIRLTAPNGKYIVKVDDGTMENKLVFNDVGLTGNVVGLEKIVEGNFFIKYRLISLFFATLILAVFIMLGLKLYKNHKQDAIIK